MQHVTRTGLGVLVVVLGSLTLSACAGVCSGDQCKEQMMLQAAGIEASAAAADAANQAAAANAATIAANAEGDVELLRMVERALAMAEQNRAALKILSEKIDRMFATMATK